jgi:hypothetical protein
VTPQEGLSVKVANDKRVTSGGVCHATYINIGLEHFSTDLYILPLDGFNIVLGIQWLRTLGPILWDFDNLMMWVDRVQWTGVGALAPHCNALSTQRGLMEALLESFRHHNGMTTAFIFCRGRLQWWCSRTATHSY